VIGIARKVSGYPVGKVYLKNERRES